MTIGTLFTLFFVPSLYVLLAADHQKKRADLGFTEGDDRMTPAEPHALDPVPAE